MAHGPDELTKSPIIDDQLEALYRERAHHVTAALRQYFGDGPPDPEDITQQAFHRLIERGDWHQIRNLPAFLWRTARNLMLDGKRADSTRSKYDFEVEEIFFPLRGSNLSPENVVQAERELKIINEVLESMSERRRRAFILHRVEGHSMAATARRLNVSETTIRRHISRALLAIEMRLEQQKRG